MAVVELDRCVERVRLLLEAGAPAIGGFDEAFPRACLSVSKSCCVPAEAVDKCWSKQKRETNKEGKSTRAKWSEVERDRDRPQ